MSEFSEFINRLWALKLASNGSKKVALKKAKNRILAKDIICKYNIPRFDNSAMDGFALILGHEKYNIKGSIFAGDLSEICVKNNDAFLITTGAKIPQNANAIAQQEIVEINRGELRIKNEIKPNQHIKFCGEDFKKGEILLKKGAILNAQNIGILSSQGIKKVCVQKKIKIAIFSSGNEIVNLNSKLQGTQIYDINSHFLRAAFAHYPCKIIYSGILKDNKKIVKSALESALKKYDIIITSGGASGGQKDYMCEVLESLGGEMLLNGLNIKPGRPIRLAKFGEKFILCLPGNPIGAFMNAILSLPILIYKKLGSNYIYPRAIEAINANDLNIKNNTAHFILGHFDGRKFWAFNAGKYQASQIKPLFQSNAIAIFQENENHAPAGYFINTNAKMGAKIRIILYECEFLDKITDFCDKKD